MMLADEILAVSEGVTERGFSLLWGQVISVSPTMVRLAGDTADTAIPLRIDAYTPTTNDKVLIARMGTTLITLGAIE